MYKLVVLSALLAVAAARPGGLLHGGVVAYSAPSVAYSAIPTAVSHQSRTDIISQPTAVITHSAPIVEKTILTAPVVHEAVVAAPQALVYAAPAVHVAHVPAAVSHTSRVDLHQTHPSPLVAVHAAPVITGVHGW